MAAGKWSRCWSREILGRSRAELKITALGSVRLVIRIDGGTAGVRQDMTASNELVMAAIVPLGWHVVELWVIGDGEVTGTVFSGGAGTMDLMYDSLRHAR